MMYPEACEDAHAATVDELFRLHAARLRGTAARFTGSASEAEDIVQDAFMRLHLAGTACVCGKGTWLRTTVIRLSLMRLRTWRRRRDRR
jgi:RNA polymerase sigma-70 factor (ECF subfamily)